MEMKYTARASLAICLTLAAFIVDVAVPLGMAGGVLYPAIGILNMRQRPRFVLVITSLQLFCLTLGALIEPTGELVLNIATRACAAILLIYLAYAARRRYQLTHSLLKQQNQMRELVNLINDGIIFTDRNNNVEHLNIAAQALIGTDLAHARKHPLHSLLTLVDERTRTRIPLTNHESWLTTPRCETRVGLLQRSGHPQEIAVECATVPMLDDENTVTGYAITLRDLTHARALTQQFVQQAADPLTGLVNRSEFERRVSRVLLAHDNNETEHMLGYVDLDGLDHVIEACGHEASDHLMQQITQLMQAKLRRRDTLARLGADEFGLLLEHCSRETALRIAEELIHVVTGFRFSWNHKFFSLSVNVGLTPLGDTTSGLDHSLAVAENACELASTHGPNQVVCENAGSAASVASTSAWPKRLSYAIEHDQLLLTLQPIRALKDSAEPVCYEALIVMLDERGNRVPAGAMLPVAARLNRAAEIDSWALRRACAWLAQQSPEHTGFCSLNVATSSLETTTFLDALLHELDALKIDPKRLCFEIAEADFSHNLDHAKSFIRAVKTRGCLIAIDHFGTGLSTLGQLHDLAIDFVKIDGSFIRSIGKTRSNLGIVNSLHQMAQLMGARTIACHAETDDALAELKKLGIDFAQGHACGRPRALKEGMQLAA